MSTSAANVQQPAKRCAILMPVGNHLDPRIDAAVAELGRRGYATFKSYGGSAIDSVRNRMATNALAEGFEETFCTDHWRCRFKPTEGNFITKKVIIELLTNAVTENIDTIKTENLYAFDGKPAFSLGQGQ